MGEIPQILYLMYDHALSIKEVLPSLGGLDCINFLKINFLIMNDFLKFQQFSVLESTLVNVGIIGNY